MTVITETATGYMLASGETHALYRDALMAANEMPDRFVAIDGEPGIINPDGSITMPASGDHRDHYAMPYTPDGAFTCVFCDGRGASQITGDDCSSCQGSGKMGRRFAS